jgi:(p)ppGpp synthase/HD superfamily hydrolase
MKYSKKQITNAGKTLLTTKSNIDRNSALEIINDWRACHIYPLNMMKTKLLKVMSKNNIKPIFFSQRLKRLTSIEYKLDLNKNMGLGGMQDIGGFRIVLKDTNDLFY